MRREHIVIENNEKNIYYYNPRVNIQYHKRSYVQFKNILLSYLPKIRKLHIPAFPKTNAELCTVFIDSRIDDIHECIIRLNLHKLGETISHYVVCTKTNYDFMKTMCASISENIQVILLDREIKNVSDYTKLLKEESFWDLFQSSKKCLLYQTDTFIFNEHELSKYVQYDYIGAPWRHKPNGVSVGNGGLSIRSIPLMREICRIHKENEIIKDNNLPEDVFFALYMQKKKAKIPTVKEACAFSIEHLYAKHSCIYFGGHQFYFILPDWEEVIRRNIEQYTSCIE